LFIGCTPSTNVITNTTIKTSCPIVLFSAEHSNYITGNTKTIISENILYRAEINNYLFNSECLIKEKVFQTELSLLFIVKPELAKKNNINLPFYVAILDVNDELVDMQYYQVEGNLKIEPDNENYIETELTKTIKLQIPLLNDKDYIQNTVVVGFMLDKNKIKILN